jgi:hypothetical protein
VKIGRGAVKRWLDLASAAIFDQESMQEGIIMAWHLTADLAENCSCNMLCPCWYGVKELMIMDQGWCAGTYLFRIRQGNADGVDLGGRTVVVAGDFPGPTLYDGDGTARVYIDAGANADQHRELEAIFQGKRGGPWEIWGGLIAKWLPTQTAKIDVHQQGATLNVTVGGFGQIKSQRLTNEAGQPTTMQNAGFATTLQFDDLAAQLAPSNGTRWSDSEMPRQFAAKSGVVATLTWRVG